MEEKIYNIIELFKDFLISFVVAEMLVFSLVFISGFIQAVTMIINGIA